MSPNTSNELDTSDVKEWRSIVTLIVFVATNIIVLFPFHLPIYVPRLVCEAIVDVLRHLRIIRSNQNHSHDVRNPQSPFQDWQGKPKFWIQLRFPLNFVTAPLIADLFLLAIRAIGRKEVHDGTIGSNSIHPLDIMAFFLTLAYIAISIDASGLIRYLAFTVLQKGGKHGHRLYLYLYAFFFGLASFIGNDPIVLSGTAFLAYMTRVSNNIKNPKAWIYTQFAVANIGSTILVSSNPTNLVLAGAFGIKFIVYTANMIVPVVVTAILLLPFLLYIVFPYESLIPSSIELHELPQEAMNEKPIDPNIPYGRGTTEDSEDENNELGQRISLQEIMNPFLNKWGAGFGAVIMAITLITILALNAATPATKERPVYWVTLPAAFVMSCWDVAFGWWHRGETRDIARRGRKKVECARALRTARAENVSRPTALTPEARTMASESANSSNLVSEPLELADIETEGDASAQRMCELLRPDHRPRTLVSLFNDAYRWSQETFPTVTAVLGHLPYALVPFALCMFVLVQALVTKGWVPVFAYGWDRWVNKTGTVGAIGGMGFLSVIMCNFAGTNIGTTILLCRIIQAWVDMHGGTQDPISQRTFWATVYSMALGVNYGAFSTAFSASLAGLLWRDILRRKHIYVRELEFARVNLRIIAFAMAVGCAALVGEVYIMRTEDPYSPKPTSGT